MNTDEYGEVINGTETYKQIAQVVGRGDACVIGWSDGLGSHLDILLVLGAEQTGAMQRGLRGSTDLFVAIMGLGASGFDTSNGATHASYYGEKLGLGQGATTDELAVLINNVKELLS